MNSASTEFSSRPADLPTDLPAELLEHSSADEVLNEQVAEVEKITRTIKNAVDADTKTSVLHLWVAAGWLFWTLTLENGGKASGRAKGPAGVAGTGKTWTTEVSVPLGSGKFALDVTTLFTHLSLKGADGSSVGDFWLAGFSQKALSGNYEGKWLVSA